MKHRRVPIIAVVAVAVLAIAAGTYLWQRTTSRVLVVGDSVTFLSAPEIRDALGRRTALEIIAEPGYTSSDLLPLAAEAVERRADDGPIAGAMVVLVGYNDVAGGEGDSDGLPQLIELSARYECAIWLTLPSLDIEPVVDIVPPAEAVRWNERTEALVAEHDNLHLVTAWAEAVNASAPEELLSEDALHPHGVGAEVLGDVMADAVAEHC
ncbi:MAG: SGNH/GDSL hydrolase family protein [Acidimicrobiales bacterium]